MLEFETAEIEQFIREEVPSYQQKILLEALLVDAESEDVYSNFGKTLTGENKKDSLLINTGPAIEKISFYDKVKHEVYLFICTNDDKYEKERNVIGKNFKEVITILSTAIAATFSLGTGVVVGIITMILISIIKINKNAWCELQKDQLKSP